MEEEKRSLVKSEFPLFIALLMDSGDEKHLTRVLTILRTALGYKLQQREGRLKYATRIPPLEGRVPAQGEPCVNLLKKLGVKTSDASID